MNTSSLLRAFLLAITVLPMTACNRGDPVTSASPGMRLVQNATDSGLPTVVEFGAETCASCREMKTVLDRVARQTQGRAHVVTLDISKEWETAQAFRIQMLPTQVFFGPDGRETWRHMGKLPETTVIARLGVGAVP
jgi:thioredoxin 1